MTRHRRVAVAVAARGVPPGLTALHVERATVDADGRTRVVGPGPSGPRRLALVAADATEDLHGVLTHGTARALLAEPTGRRSSREGGVTDDVAFALARAGLVRLQVPATTEAGTVVAGQWRSWERTPLGTRWAERYAAVDGTDPVVARAVAAADRLDAGGIAAWEARVASEVDHLAAVCRTATDLVDDGTAHGWSLARFAEEVTGDAAGLDDGAPLASIVLGRLAVHLGVDVAGGVDRERLLRAAGVGGSLLAGTVACARLPGGGGAVGALLTAAAGHDVPLVLQQALLVDHGGRPIAPPRSLSWVFAVQHADTFDAVVSLPVRTPVVLHGGSPAAVHLLQHAVVAGWRVAVCADADPAGRARQAWLVDRLGEGAVAWRGDADGVGPGERDQLDQLLADVRTGRPG